MGLLDPPGASRTYVDEAVNGAASALQAQVQSATQSANTATQAAIDAKTESDNAAAYALAAVFKTTTASAGASFAIGADGSTVSVLTLVNDVTQLTIPNNVPSGLTRQYTVLLKQGVGARKVIWGANINWVGKREPVLAFAPGSLDVLSFMVIGGEANVQGFYNGESA